MILREVRVKTDLPAFPPGHQDPYDNGYTPHDKPAEDVLRSWFGALPRRVSPSAPESNEFRTMDIFTDGLGSGWEDWSWDAVRDPAATDQVHSGKFSLRAKLSPWGALSFWHPPFASQPYYWLEFSIRSGQGTAESWIDDLRLVGTRWKSKQTKCALS